MSFDNPSRKASPWTTLKRTVKTKSLRLVRFVSPFQPGSKPHRSIARSHLRLTRIGYPPSWRLVDWRCKWKECAWCVRLSVPLPSWRRLVPERGQQV